MSEHQHAIAMNPAQMPPGEYLQPYAQEMGIKPEMLAKVKTNN